MEEFDIVIIGGGIVGLTIAYQAKKKEEKKKIVIIDKECELGLHTSGRNSGVIHAGIYYKPNTIKAQVCIKGGKRLKSWVKKRDLPINECGKLIVAQREDLDSQLDLLADRGTQNGADLELCNSRTIEKIVPGAYSASGRAIWCPQTAVIKPITVIQQLRSELLEKGVTMILGDDYNIEPDDNKIEINKGIVIRYKNLVNCAGLGSLEIANRFNVGNEYEIIPFKGLYWEIMKGCEIDIRTNLYPVPDLKYPFLGVHFTPDAINENLIYIGPTATLAWGKENYRGISNIELNVILTNLKIMAPQYIKNLNNMRTYMHNQALLNIPQLFIKEAKAIFPTVSLNQLRLSRKVGIRPQLYNKRTMRLEDDFVLRSYKNTHHVINAISPAFTASFELADMILETTGLIK